MYRKNAVLMVEQSEDTVKPKTDVPVEGTSWWERVSTRLDMIQVLILHLIQRSEIGDSQIPDLKEGE